MAALEALSDLEPEGLVHLATVRAPVRRGSLLSVSTGRLPPGYRLVLPADIPGANRLRSFGSEIPILADKAVSYEGEPVALVCGPDPAVVESLAREAVVECAEEEPFLAFRDPPPERVALGRLALRGDPDLAFSIAPSVLESGAEAAPLEHWYSEPQGALAHFDYDKLLVRTATQWPYHARDSVALALGCRPEEVIVRPTRLGVHLDGRLWYPSLLACHAALAARLFRAPARILLSREEDLRFTPKRARSSTILRAAPGREGELAALDVRLTLDIGAYGPLAGEIVARACAAATGHYACPNVRVEARAVVTNTAPGGAFSDLGESHAFLALESAVTRLAIEAGEDPMDWRSRNILRKGATPGPGEALREDPPFDPIAARIAAASDFHRKHAAYELVRKRRAGRVDGPLRGIGFAFAWQGGGAFVSDAVRGPCSVEVELDKELTLSIRSSAACRRAVLDCWRRVAAETLALPLASVRVLAPDTDTAPDAGPMTLSRGIAVMTRLVERACLAIQKRRFREALPLQAKAAWRSPPPLFRAEGDFPRLPLDGAAWGGAAVELELDPWTLSPLLKGLWLCVDGGRIMDRRRAEASLRGATLGALGACLRERLEPGEGRIGRRDYLEYGLLREAEAPPIVLDFLDPDRQGWPRGIGELPFDTVPAAFQSALSQAAGLPLSALPYRVDELVRAAEDA